MPEGIVLSGKPENEVQLRRCHNPWKPHSHQGQSEVYRRMLGILNRVTEQSVIILLEQTQTLPLSDPTHLPHILALLLTKAQDEPMFASIYAYMVHEIAARLRIQESVAAACQEHFHSNYQLLLEFNQNMQNPAPTPIIHEEIQARKKLIGHIGFVSELQKVGVVSSQQVSAMVETFLQHSDDRSLECLCRLLSFSGSAMSRDYQDLMERSIIYLRTRLTDGNLSPRMKFLTIDTLDLQENGWQPRIGGRILTSSLVRDVRG